MCFKVKSWEYFSWSNVNASTTYYSNKGHINLIKYLLENGADIQEVIECHNRQFRKMYAPEIKRFYRQYARDNNITELSNFMDQYIKN